MGKIEDIMVYTKLVILTIISFVLMNNSQTSLPVLLESNGEASILSILIVASLTFVAYEGFQLVIHAMDDMEEPNKNIPRAIYTALVIAIAIYVVISLGAILAIPLEDIVEGKEYALAAGAGGILGHWGTDLVILGALLASSSAISGTLFGASRLMAVIAKDGYLPEYLTVKTNGIPIPAVVTIALFSFILVLIGGLQLILEFGSVTFLFVSLLMAYANFKIRHLTQSSLLLTVLAMLGLACGALLIFYYEFSNEPEQMIFIGGLYVLLTAGAWRYSKMKCAKKDSSQNG